jgi:hypothetical protein
MGLLEALGLPPLANRSPARSEAAAESAEPGGAGNPGGQDSQDQADRARIEQLKRWQKEGKIKGDSSGLREQLRDKRNKPLQREARRKFDEISRQVRAGAVPDLAVAAGQTPARNDDPRGRQGTEKAPGSHEDAPRTQAVSSADKKPLGQLLRRFGLSSTECREVGEWLKKGHREGQYGAEAAPNSTRRTSDGHDHHYTPAEVEKMLQDYEATTGRRVGTKARSTPPSSAPTPSVIRKLPTIEKASGVYKKAIAVYFSNYVQLPLRLVREFDQALQTIGNFESALRGQGFVLDQQVSLAKALASATASQLTAWRAGNYHAMIDAAFRVAQEIDREDPEGMYGTDALSTFCADIELAVAQHESDSASLLAGARKVAAEVDQGETITSKLLGDAAFMAAAALTHHEKLVFMVWQDFRQIQSILVGVPSSLERHHKEVEADLARVRASMVGSVVTGVFVDE